MWGRKFVLIAESEHTENCPDLTKTLPHLGERMVSEAALSFKGAVWPRISGLGSPMALVQVNTLEPAH